MNTSLRAAPSLRSCAAIAGTFLAISAASLPVLLAPLGCRSTEQSAAALPARVVTEQIKYAVNGQEFTGTLAYDANRTDARPGVIIFHEWWGNTPYTTGRAKELAALGYVAFAADMYGTNKTTDQPAQAQAFATEVYKDPAIMRQRATAGMTTALKSGRIDPTRVAAIGYCFGGSCALELARTGATLKSVVTFHTSGLTAANEADNARVRANILVCNGQDDAMVPSQSIEDFKGQMSRAGVKHQIMQYPGAVHSFTNKAADSFNIPSVAYNAQADAQSWKDMLAHFEKTNN